MISPTPKTLKQRILYAGSWTLAGHGLSQVIRLASNLVMARLLAPEMFGVMAIVITISMILAMFSDLGLHQNIVQSQRGEEPVFLDTAWVIQIARGFVISMVMLLLSIGLYLAGQADMLSPKTAYASPELPLVIAVYSISAIISGFQSTKIATAYRDFEQRRITEITLISQFAGLIVMITIGVIDRSIWALVSGALVSALATTVLSHTWMRGHVNRWRFEKKSARELFDFGKWVFISSAFYMLTMSGDKLLFGAFVESDVLGVYVIASLFITAINGTLEKLFFNVSLPALSEIARKEPKRLREIYNKLCIPGDLMLIFLTGFLFEAGHWLITLLYDQRYATAGSMLEILALSLFAVRYEIARQAYLSLGLPHYATVMSVVRFIALCALIPLLYYLWGTQGAVWGMALHPLIAVPFVYYFNSKLGLIDIRREMMVLVALPIGFLSGSGLNLILAS
jgi:O-antigen/teichoic acid export membrane protein